MFQVIFKLETRRSPEFLEMHCRFVDVLSGQPRYVVLRGNWIYKSAIIYLGGPLEGGVRIGKIHRREPLTCTSFFIPHNYIIEVTPGVDIALIAMMVIALDI